jgi:hypothetical protein
MQDIRNRYVEAYSKCNVASPWTPYKLVQSCHERLLGRCEELVNLGLELGSKSANLLASSLERLSHVLADGRSVHLLNLLVGLVGRVGLGDSLELFQTVLALRVLDLVATSGDDLGVVGRATTVPGKDLVCVSKKFKHRKMELLTLAVSEGTSSRAPTVAMERRSALSFLGVISATA